MSERKLHLNDPARRSGVAPGGSKQTLPQTALLGVHSASPHPPGNHGGRPRTSRVQLWLWPNLLSLDAPLVAVAWQWLFVRCLHGQLPLPASILLGATVWLIYAGDRMLDAWRGASAAERHRFYGRHWRMVSVLWLIVLVAGAWLAWRELTVTLWLHGVMVALVVGVYLIAVHAVPGLWPMRIFQRGAKEAAVGLTFAAGVTLVAWPKITTPTDIAAIGMFALLCWMNCVAIEDWERGERARNGVWMAAAVVALAAVLILSGHRPVVAAAETSAALGLLLLDRYNARWSREAVRVLADLVLLTPLLFVHVAGRIG